MTCAWRNISITEIVAAMEVSFSMPIMLLPRAGKAVRKVWGMTTCHMIFGKLMPTQYPSSRSPARILLIFFSSSSFSAVFRIG